ncbi:hypothetical protein PR202_gb26987 [Eleusine coracana subsp. coracana]|uniref:Uncharacterized protein n=1 Tax=Eleusine coracana subsp. coracana TaxID=191504 RepID=A0AAV5FSK8_ELECO|nr:hypothetical protein PR202_gb26987 [Eleusine coracana subsp. coracana]
MPLFSADNPSSSSRYSLASADITADERGEVTTRRHRGKAPLYGHPGTPHPAAGRAFSKPAAPLCAAVDERSLSLPCFSLPASLETLDAICSVPNSPPLTSLIDSVMMIHTQKLKKKAFTSANFWLPPLLQGVLLGLSNTAGVLAGVFGTAATGYILQHGLVSSHSIALHVSSRFLNPTFLTNAIP